jgi:hypothetical protein
MAVNYASVYWEEDILGIVLLDGGTGGKSNPIDMVSGMLTSIEIPIISSILTSILSFILPIISDIYGALPLGIPLLGTILGLLLFEILPSIPLLGMEMYTLDMAMDMGILNPLISLFVGIEDLINQYIELPLGLYIYNIPHFQDVRDYAIDHPLDPPLDPVTGERLKPYTHPITGKPIENYMEWSAALLYKEGIPGMFTNIYGGYNDLESLSYIAETFDRYWPLEVYLEYAADIARPGYTTDSGIWDRDYPNFYADYKEIDVPLIAFISGGLGLLVWGPFSPGIKNEDVTGYTLPEWGHLDMYAGTYNDVMINEPTYQWLMERI